MAGYRLSQRRVVQMYHRYENTAFLLKSVWSLEFRAGVLLMNPYLAAVTGSKESVP